MAAKPFPFWWMFLMRIGRLSWLALLSVALWGGVQLHTGKVRENAFWGINHSWLDLLIESMPAGVPDFKDYDLATKAEQYAKTGEKRFLVRTPSLAVAHARNAGLLPPITRSRLNSIVPRSAGGVPVI